MRHHGDAILLDSRVEQLEREQAAAKEREETYKQEYLDATKKIAVFTLLLVISGALAGGIGIWQAFISQKSANAAMAAVTQSKENNSDAIKAQREIAADALTTSQKNFRDSLKASDIGVQKTLREMESEANVMRQQLSDVEAVQAARLVFEEPKMDVIPMQDGNFRLQVTLVIHNVGESAAEGIGLHRQQSANSSDCQTAGHIPLGQPTKGGMVIGKGETKEFPYAAGAGTKEQMINNEQLIMLLPRASYTDVFGHPHITSDCWTYSTNRKFDMPPRLEHCSCLIQNE